MSMDKRFLVLALLLLFSSFAFASPTLNTIEHFSLSWNPSTNQLNISAQCKGETPANLILQNGQMRVIICPTVDVGATWMIGDQTGVGVMGARLEIQQPCKVCSAETTIDLLDPKYETPVISSSMVFGGLIILALIVFVLIFEWLNSRRNGQR